MIKNAQSLMQSQRNGPILLFNIELSLPDGSRLQVLLCIKEVYDGPDIIH